MDKARNFYARNGQTMKPSVFIDKLPFLVLEKGVRQWKESSIMQLSNWQAIAVWER
jgi:hypothetical protein